MNYIYNSLDLKSKRPFGAIKQGQVVDITFRVVDGVFVKKIDLVLTKDNEDSVFYQLNYFGKEEREGKTTSIFTISVQIKDPGLYWYYFNIDTEFGVDKAFKGDDGWATLNSDRQYQITVFDSSYKTPDFLKGGNVYQIFVDSFNKSKKGPSFKKKGVLKNWGDDVIIFDKQGIRRANDFYGGNLKGIEEKLDYLKSLNIKLIYLTPIFQSPSNHRYDISNYFEIDDLLGNTDDLKSLISKAKKKGIAIMIDGVFNHTGADSLYFNKFGNFESLGAYQSKQSQFYNWYEFIDFPEKYNCWWGVTIAPSIRKDNTNFHQFIAGDKGVIEKWNKVGINGWRLDVVDELNEDFVHLIRKKVKEKDENNLLIGEVWEDASSKISYSRRRPYLMGKQLDGVMNYVFRDAILDFCLNNDTKKFSNKVMDIVENYPKQSLDVSLTLIDSHDTWRAINLLSKKDVSKLSLEQRKALKLSMKSYLDAKRLLKMAVFLQFTLPGVPMIYYGDEIGMEGYDDPINRRSMKWEDIDEELLSFYKNLANMRRIYKHLFVGNFLTIRDDKLLIYERHSARRRGIFIINNSDEDIEIPNDGYIKSVWGGLDIKDKTLKIKAKNFYLLEKLKTSAR